MVGYISCMISTVNDAYRLFWMCLQVLEGFKFGPKLTLTCRDAVNYYDTERGLVIAVLYDI